MDFVKAFDESVADTAFVKSKDEFATLTCMSLMDYYVDKEDFRRYLSSEDESIIRENYCGLDYITNTDLYKKTKISIPILKMVDVLITFGDFTYENICRIIYESVLRLYYDAEEGE